MQESVNHEEVRDYDIFVKEDDEMWILRIVQKLQVRAYSSVAQFRADVQQILTNCKAYNSHGCGLQRSAGKPSSRLEMQYSALT